MTKLERTTRFDALSGIGCIVCLNEGFQHSASIHHLTGIAYRGTGKKAADEHTIPLCYLHHQGNQGIHRIGMKPWELKFGTQETLLRQVNELIRA